MILHRNSRFHIGRFSFSLPDDVYLNTIPDVQIENGLELVTPDEQLTIALIGEDSEEGALEGLEQLLETFQPLSDIEPVSLNGLGGYCMYYYLKKDAYCEYRFELPEGEEGVNMISLLITTCNDSSVIQKITEHPSIRDLLRSCSLESK